MKKREVKGWPAFLLVVLPALVGYVVIVKATLEELF